MPSPTDLARRAAAAPVAVAGVVLVVVLVVLRPSLVRSSLTNGRAWLLAAVLVGIAVGLPPLLRRLGAGPGLARSLALLPTVLALVAVLVPSFRTRTLDEALPEAFTTRAPAVVASPSTTGAAPVAVPEASVAVPEASTAPAPAPAASTSPAAAAPAPVPPAVTVVAAGNLRGIDHAAEGAVRVLESDGARLLSFDDVTIESSPDHQVYLVPGSGRRSPGDGAVHLGSLKAERGSFSYAVPAGFDTSGEFTVLLWCGRFQSPNGHASLA